MDLGPVTENRLFAKWIEGTYTGRTDCQECIHGNFACTDCRAKPKLSVECVRALVGIFGVKAGPHC